jgi:hypothetical protein
MAEADQDDLRTLATPGDRRLGSDDVGASSITPSSSSSFCQLAQNVTESGSTMRPSGGKKALGAI